MPELPEVQTTVNGLNATVKGKKIIGVWTDYKRHKIPRGFERSVVGRRILEAERRAKNILIHLSGGETLLVHMKMTGHFVYALPEYPHIRFSLRLGGGKLLSLSDMRRFAKIVLIKTSDLDKSKHLENLGPEPLEADFKFRDFKSRLSKRPKGRIKSVLMDPSIIAGIGNIYSDEILWHSGVHPLSIVDRIPEKSLKKMFLATKTLLKKGVRLGGDSMSDYRNIKGERGNFQEHHRAYRQTGKKCTRSRCTGTITRLVIGSRSAHFCPKHQVLYKG